MLKKITSFILSSSLLFSLLPVFSSAQTAPTSQPLVQSGDMVYLGKITAPPTDGTGRGNSVDSLDYGAFGLGMGPDGKSLYFACHDWHDQIARITIPAIGQQASIVTPCTAINNKTSINPGDPNGINPGGMLVWNNKLIVTMYPYYDANGTAVGSHFSMNTDMTSQTGPFRLYPGPDSKTNRVGMVSGYMGLIPQEWRSLLGGPALSGQMGIPIINRTSFGPTATVFDPDQIGQGSSASKMLVGYPNEHQTLGGYSQANPLFSGSDQVGGLAFPDGTRSVLFVGRHAATFCYGYGTSNQALHGTVDSAGVMFCYDPTSSNKGTHGYPYIHQVWAYDANDLLAVKNGTKQPWDLRPYATWKLTEMNNDGGAGAIASATYDPATKRFYMATGRTIHVYQVNVGTTAPQPTPDNTAPVVSITSPASSSTVSGSSVSVSANATDNVSVSGVQFKVNGVNLGAEDTTAPYGVTWNTTTYTNGSHTVTAVARDSSGNTTTSSGVSVNVSNTTAVTPTADIKVNGSDGPISVPATSGVSLSWTSTNATSCSVTPGSYTGLTGTQTTSAIEAGRTYTLSCAGAGGTKTDSVIVNPSSSTIVDTTKPTVNLTAPSTFTTVAGIPVFVSADATDNVGVVGVQFKLDGVNLGAEDTTAPYSTIWDTTNATEGSHVLTAVARDAAGNTTTSSSVTVTVTKTDPVDTVKPSVNITDPVNNEEVSGSVNISATASDDTGVVGVQFKLNGTNLNSEDNTAPYTTAWNSETVSNGSYTLTAVARDAAGNSMTSSGVSVTVNNVSEDALVVPPEVELLEPSSGGTISGIVTVTASAEDDKGVAAVQFKLDGVNLLPEDTTEPYSISWDTKTSPNGSRSLTATARDVEGNQVTSVARVINISNTTPTSNLKIGDKIKTTAWINVRSTAGGRYVGSQRTGRTGVITAGPGYANGLTWWKVNFTSGADGWVAEKFITKATVAMTQDDYRKNIANIYLLIKYLQDKIAGQNN